MKKTVLITGSSTGIGRASAFYFQKMGWNVAATMRTPEKETELIHLENVKVYKLDVLDETGITNTIKKVMADFGNLDVVVNNAGYGAVGAFEAASEVQIKRQFDTNVFGVMNVTRSVLPYFREKKSGTIINVTSMGGLITFPLYSLYHGTKWAVEGFSESLQFELNPFNIRVKLVEPGAIKTDFYDRSMDLFKKDGLTAYDSYTALTMPNMQAAGANGPGPEVVAKTIFKAASDGKKKMRYPVGSNAPLLLMLRRILPNFVFFGIVKLVIERKSKS
ncbi:MAG: SDR family oxidoreductase [Bacteroidetes bacterium]|nr:SDR family oxidoreductase [Bacteroidota bacterium]